MTVHQPLGFTLNFGWEETYNEAEGETEFWVVLLVGNTEVKRLKFHSFVDTYGDGGTTPEEAIIIAAREIFTSLLRGPSG